MNNATGMDLMLMLVLAFVVLLGKNIQEVQQEKLTSMNNSAGELGTPAVLTDGAELAMGEISIGEDEEPEFHFRTAGAEEPERLADYAALIRTIESNRPDYLRLRVDRAVPSGLYQDLVVDASLLGITVLQSNSRNEQ